MALADTREERSRFFFLRIIHCISEGQFHVMAELGQVSANEFLKEDFTQLGEAFSTQLWNISLIL